MQPRLQRRRLLQTLAALAPPRGSMASEFPKQKPTRMVVPFAAGGSSDVVCRMLATPMAASLKQTEVVENRAGAGGTIGSDVVAKAAPDGYTLLLVDALHIISPLFNRNTLSAPDISTIAESGLAGFDVSSWYAIMPPARTPPDIVNALADEVRRIVALPDVRQTLAAQGLVPVAMAPVEFAAHIRRETATWAKIIRDANN